MARETEEDFMSKLVSVGGLAIPPLHQDELIKDWQPLFLAAVIPLLDRKEEGKIIQMLPSFVCKAAGREAFSKGGR